MTFFLEFSKNNELMDEVYNSVHYSILKNDSFKETIYWLFHIDENDKDHSMHVYKCLMEYFVKYVSVENCMSFCSLQMNLKQQQFFLQKQVTKNDRLKMLSLDVWMLNMKKTSSLFLNQYYDSLNQLAYNYKSNEITDLCGFIRTMNVQDEKKIELEMDLKNVFFEMEPHVRNKYQDSLSMPIENIIKYLMHILQCSRNIKSCIQENDPIKPEVQQNLDKYERLCFLLCHLLYCALIVEKRRLKTNYYSEICKFAKSDSSKKKIVDFTIFSIKKKPDNVQRMSYLFSSPEIVIWYTLLSVNQKNNQIWSLLLFLLNFYICFDKSEIIYDCDQTKNTSSSTFTRNQFNLDQFNRNNKMQILFYAVHCHFNHFKSKFDESRMNNLIQKKTKIIDKNICTNTVQYCDQLRKIFDEKTKDPSFEIIKKFNNELVFDMDTKCVNMYTERGSSVMNEELMRHTIQNTGIKDVALVTEFSDARLNEIQCHPSQNDMLFFERVNHCPNQQMFVYKKQKTEYLHSYNPSEHIDQLCKTNIRQTIEKSHLNKNNIDSSLYSHSIHLLYKEMHTKIIEIIGHQSLIKNSNNKQINKTFTTSSLTKSISNMAEYETISVKKNNKYKKELEENKNKTLKRNLSQTDDNIGNSDKESSPKKKKKSTK